MATTSSGSPATPAPRNPTNIVTALGNAFKIQNGEHITGERIAQLLAQNIGQLNELVRQGKLNQQQFQQLKEYAGRYNKSTPAPASLVRAQAQQSLAPPAPPADPTNNTITLGNPSKIQNSVSVADEPIAQLLAQIFQLGKLVRQGKLNQQEIQQLKELTEKYNEPSASTAPKVPTLDTVEGRTHPELVDVGNSHGKPALLPPYSAQHSGAEKLSRLPLNVHEPVAISFDSSTIPAPPDLTPYISKADDYYTAGGGFGDVYRCWYHGHISKEVAVKAFRFRFVLDDDTDDRSHKMLRRELGIWRRLNHTNVVPFLGIAYGFGMRDAMSLVSLWMSNGSLHNLIRKHNLNLGVDHRLQFLLDIANGLHYLHSFPIVHGDLNCNNVLLDEDYTARLADFGYASLVGNIPEALTYLQRTTTRPGALRWSAPEQIMSNEEFNRTPKSDIYSFGCTALQVLSGKQPWSEVGEDVAVVYRLVKGQKPERPESQTLHDEHWGLIQKCWSPIEERPPAEDVVSSIKNFLSGVTQRQSLCDVISLSSNRATDSHVDQPFPSGDAGITAGSSSRGMNVPEKRSYTSLSQTERISESLDSSSSGSQSNSPGHHLSRFLPRGPALRHMGYTSSITEGTKETSSNTHPMPPQKRRKAEDSV